MAPSLLPEPLHILYLRQTFLKEREQEIYGDSRLITHNQTSPVAPSTRSISYEERLKIVLMAVCKALLLLPVCALVQ